MKVRQSASLVAGICTVCVAASTSVTPLSAAAATKPEVNSPVVRPFELTAASDALIDGVNLAGLPLENFVRVLSALAGAAGGGNGVGGGAATSFQALPNLLYSQLVAGTLTEATATSAINAAIATERTALTNLFGGSVAPVLGLAAVTQSDTSTTAVDAINVASLPLQNGIAALNALAGAAGGGNGVGGGGAASFQALPNVLYSQLVAGTLTQASATAALNAARATEQTALTNLAATPGKIIATDVAAIQKLSNDFGVGASSVVSKPTASNDVTNAVADRKDAKDATGGTAGPARHAAKTNDGNPVSSAVKAIRESAKGAYVGKHRAEAVGEKSAAGKGNGGGGAKESSEK